MKRNRLFFGLLVLGAIALWIASASPFAPACLALLCLPVPVSLLWNKLCMRGLQSEIAVEPSAEKGKPIRVTLRVGGAKRMPAAGISAVLLAENTLTGSTEEVSVVLRPRGKAYEARKTYTSRYCGQVRFRVKELRLPDLYGVAALKVPAGCKASCTVFPVTFRMDCRDILLPPAKQDTDSYAQQGRGSDPTEVFQLREYVPGDPLRGIHWKLSSKTGTLIYRDPSAPVRRAMLIYWDRNSGTPRQKDALAECVFSLCQALSEAGYPFSLGYACTVGCTVEDVSDADALADKLPALLRRGEGDRTQLPDLAEFGRTLWFTADAAAVPDQEDVYTLLCSDTQALISVAGMAFTPDNYITAMQRLDLHDETHG